MFERRTWISESRFESCAHTVVVNKEQISKNSFRLEAFISLTPGTWYSGRQGTQTVIIARREQIFSKKFAGRALEYLQGQRDHSMSVELAEDGDENRR
jgi:hypothetical protein